MFLKQKKGRKNGKGHRRHQKFTASQPARSRSVLIRRSAARIWIIRVTRTRGPRNGRWSIQLTIQSSGHLGHPGASCGILWHESGSESTGRRRVGIEHRKSIENRLWNSIEGTCFNRFFNGKKNILNTTASHSRHSIIHWSMESIPSLHHSMIWCRRLCDDLDLKEISMPRSFFWDDWTNTQDEKHILNLLEDGTLKLASQNHMRFTSCWNMLKPYVPDFQGKG